MTNRGTGVGLFVLAAAFAVALGIGLGLQAGRPIDEGLGAASPPFLMGWLPRLEAGGVPWLIGAALVIALGVGAAPRLERGGIGRPVPVLVALLGLGAGAALCVNAIPIGTVAWTEVFELGPKGNFEAGNEYLPGLPALGYGAGFFLDRFAELNNSLPVNVAGHPPGLMLVIHWTRIETAAPLAALCITAAAALSPLTFALARSAGLDGPTATRAGLLAAFSPIVVLFGATSADAIYAALGTGAAALMVSARLPLRVAGCVLLAIASLFSWALLAMAAFAAVLVWRRDGWRPALVLALGAAAATVALQGALALGTGYDPIGALVATERYYRNSLASVRPYAYWVLGSPMAFLAMLGPAVAGAFVVAARRGTPVALALAFVLIVAAVGGFTKAETERIWLPFAPMACVAAASVIPTGWMRPVLLLLGAQALAVSLLFGTVW